ncbi:hypothetical protein AMTR_s00088p00016720 [Amborella trichopoda]|uniref:F-box domain-containing protein n=1 Tax=Amborella trichopoda TaxID=13333 RepID=W1NV45_AMBTC|nr:hypothetical protein AMTR_s00088p00016720 [Amborella trichopoda]
MLVPLPPEGSRPLVIAPSTGDIFCMRTPFSSSSSSPSFLWRYSPNADPETWEPLCIPSYASLVTTCNQHLGRKSYVPLSTITATLLGHHLYVAGGLPVPAASRYDLHAKTWERLPDMHHLRVQAASTECEGLIYVVGGRALDTRYSAEVYDPTAGAWTLIKDFVPQPAEECVVATLGKRLVMLTRSKIEPEWQLRVRDGEAWHELGEVPDSVGQGWRRAEMVPVGNEIWVVEDRWWMLKCVGGGIRVWPTFSGPGFWPEGNAVGGREGFANAFSLVDGGKGVEWRKIPIFSVPVKGL